ncbi:MAG: type II secretion system F family protein [Magnetococcales bacterium]|nr:type II secretion system F family protein [Magnetococcales bacterium]
MPIFFWKATSKNGPVHKGEFLAENVAAALARLRKQGYRDVSIQKRPTRGGMFASRRVKEQDIVLFIRQLSVMINAGLPLSVCFRQVGRGSDKPAVHEAALRIRDAIEMGGSLSQAMGAETALFDDFTINLIRVAEKSGVLNTVLDRVATYKEKMFLLKGKIKSALTYPMAVMAIATLIFYLLMVKVVPVFVDLYASFHAELPLPTRMIVSLSDFTQSWGGAALLGILVLYKGFALLYRRSERVHHQTDKMLLFLPYFGELLRKSAITRFARSFSAMLAAGTPILDCLETVAKTSGNRVLEETILDARQAIMEGRSLTEPLEESDIFPPLVTQMIYIGETTGSLDFMLNKVADYYDEEVDRAIDTLKALMEPLIMVLLGGMIGSIVLGLYLPMLGMGGMMG